MLALPKRSVEEFLRLSFTEFPTSREPVITAASSRIIRN
jgi:hypothetical protein